MRDRLAIAVAGAFLAGCATPPPATAPEPSPPPPPEHLAPPNTAPAPQVSIVEPKALPAAPAPSPAQPATQDALDRAQIEQAFDAHRRYFWKLYTARLQTRPRLKGRMLVSFTIEPAGTPRDVILVDSDMEDPALERAILREVGAMRFPPARNPTPVTSYPLVFSAPKATRR